MEPRLCDKFVSVCNNVTCCNTFALFFFDNRWLSTWSLQYFCSGAMARASLKNSCRCIKTASSSWISTRSLGAQRRKWMYWFQWENEDMLFVSFPDSLTLFPIQGLRVLTKVYVVIFFSCSQFSFPGRHYWQEWPARGFWQCWRPHDGIWAWWAFGRGEKKQHSYFAQTIFLQVSGPCTYDNMVKLFQDKMAGGKFIFYSASGAPHKPRNEFVKLIDLKPFSFLPLASSKV